jgi:SAM-dependent methyltransferase
MPVDEMLLVRFPKERPVLPEAYRAIYESHYRQNREGGSPASRLSKAMESWMHRKIAEDIAIRKTEYTTLEVGCGGLNHLSYEALSKRYDVVEPIAKLVEQSPRRSRVRNVYSDIREIHDTRFDRIVSIAAFEHYCDLPRIVANCGVLLAPGGQLRVAVPSEGTLLWTLGWRFTTGIEFRLKHRLDYGTLMRHEHVNTADEIAGVLKIFFKSVRCSVLGISPALSFYQFFQCAEPDLRRCEDYLLIR